MKVFTILNPVSIKLHSLQLKQTVSAKEFLKPNLLQCIKLN